MPEPGNVAVASKVDDDFPKVHQIWHQLSYGSIRSALEKVGQTIGVNDLHIAAHARSEGLTLVSNNLREFERVPALQLANWVAWLITPQRCEAQRPAR